MTRRIPSLACALLAAALLVACAPPKKPDLPPRAMPADAAPPVPPARTEPRALPEPAAAVAPQESREPSPPPQAVPEPPPAAEPERAAEALQPRDASPAERRRQAQHIVQGVVELLSAGEEGKARAELERALALDSGNKLATSLLRQLTVDPVQELGERSFPYAVRPGETLSGIAARFLGDPVQFYILARYNGIAVPARVPAGELIRIPGEEPSEAAAKARPEAPAEPEPTPQAAPEKTPEAPPLPASAPAPEPVSRPAPEPAPEPAPPAAVAPPRPAPALPPGAPPVPTAADRAFQQGLREQARGNNLKAYEAFRQSYALDPTLRDARSNAELMHREIVADYQRRAQAALARQDLRGAVDNWNLLLDFDPANETALAERRKALDLLGRGAPQK